MKQELNINSTFQCTFPNGLIQQTATFGSSRKLLLDERCGGVRDEPKECLYRRLGNLRPADKILTLAEAI